MLELLVVLVERFETEHYEIPRAAPHEVLEFLLEQRGMRPVSLVPVLGSRGHFSDTLTGRRKISAEKARELGAFFDVDPGLFVQEEELTGFIASGSSVGPLPHPPALLLGLR